MTEAAFRHDLRRSRASIEQAAGTRVLGYRAPDFSISRQSLWALVVLAEEGYAYDSSLFPFSGPRYGVAESFAEPCQVETRAGGLVEFPLTTTEWLGRRWPAAGGGYFRLLPHAWHRAAIERLNRSGSPATSYFHPYETDTRELRSSPHSIPLKLRLSQGLGRSRVAPRLRRLLREFRWGPARDHLERGAALTGGRTLDLRSLASSGPLWRAAAGP